MTFRSSDRAREKALASLTREAADLATPELDWDKLEKNVLAAFAVAAEPPTSPAHAMPAVPRVSPAPTWASTPWPMALCAAAAAALIYGSTSSSVHTPARSSADPAGASAHEAVTTRLSELEVGEVAQTGRRAAQYDKPGVVSLAVAPNSRVEVVANDLDREHSGGITVNLARGSLHAEVTPRSFGEVFAVEVERTRIAVHGTSFTVTREGDKVVVEVAHGSVAVGPVGHPGATHGWLVVGPDRAAFTLDGAREATWLPADETAVAVVEPAAGAPPVAALDAHASRVKRQATAPARGEPVASSARGDNSAPASKVSGWGEGAHVEGRDPSEHEAAEASSIVRQLAACYEKQASAFSFRFSVDSALKLTILPTGAIREGVFSPPLSPTLMTCADKAIGGAHFPRGEGVREIHIPVHLAPTPR
jgi:hypothetical protein